MFYFVWDSSLDTGIDIIDTQHRRIVDYINQLHDAIAKSNHAAVHNVLDEVVDYTLTHFTFEEKMMERAGYQHCEAHRVVHEAFSSRMRDYRDRLARGEDVTKRLLSDLRIWLTNHIKNEDRDYIPVVKAHLQGDGDRGWLSKTLSRLFSR